MSQDDLEQFEGEVDQEHGCDGIRLITEVIVAGQDKTFEQVVLLWQPKASRNA